MISGGSYQNRGQSIDSPDDSLFATLIAAKNTAFMAPFTGTRWEGGN